MATTSIWRVKGWLGKVVVYVENPDKTENPLYFEKHDMTDSEIQRLSDVIDYAVNDEKTKNKKSILDDETTPIMERFVSGVNCLPENARADMLKVKKRFGKEGGVVAYHGYQSFAPDDLKAGLTPEMAHEVGVKLAEKLWGKKYQVLVTTHLDKAHHLHNHFVLNTVSFVDGIRYYRSEKDYYNMQVESDKLCHEYGLDVIEEPKRGKSKHFAEWQAEKEGRPTYRSMMRMDIDRAIAESMTMQQFWDNLKKQGYTIRNEDHKDISLRGAGKDKGLKMVRNFGSDYSVQAISDRILANTRPQRRIIPADKPPRHARFTGNLNTIKRVTGLRALYFYYLYKMGVYPKKRETSPNRVYFLFREDIRFIQNISKETRLLVKHGIDTAEQLTAHKDGLTAEIISLFGTRKHLRYRARSIRDGDKLAAVKNEIAALSEKIGTLRREVRLCEDIEKRSADMTEKIQRAAEDEKLQGKEMNKHEPFRRRR